MERFSCYWKNVRLKHPLLERLKKASKSFSCYWKNVRLKLRSGNNSCVELEVSVVIERMYDWSKKGLLSKARLSSVSVVIERMYDWSLAPRSSTGRRNRSFSCYWKNVRLKLSSKDAFWLNWPVSVVIERMYDWSSETNWLKINDFWQLVSGLFFENGRSAQKVPLFSKIWGDCLTVFDSCGNI